MKVLKPIFLAILLCINLLSCKNDYNAIDISNARPGYSIELDQKTTTDGTWLNAIKATKFKTFKPGVDNWGDYEPVAVVEECDSTGTVLYRGPIRRFAAAGTDHIDVIYTYYCQLHSFYWEKVPIMKIRTTLEDFQDKPLNMYSINGDSKYKMELPPDMDRQYLYWLSCSCLDEILEKTDELGYELAGCEYYLRELDTNKNLLTSRPQPKSNIESEWLVSSKGTKWVEPRIEVYGWPISGGWTEYSKKTKMFEITFGLHDIQTIKDKETKLTEKDYHAFEMSKDFPETYKYWLDYSCSDMYSVLEEHKYTLSGADYYVIEKDKDGTQLAKVARPKNKNDMWIQSSEGAYSVTAYIEITGWPIEDGRTNYSKQKKVMTIAFEPLLLKNIVNNKITLTSADKHTYTFY